MTRPGVVWFGEALPDGIMAVAEQVARSADVFLVVGTSAVVYPAAGLIPLARNSGARVIEVNPEQTPHSGTAHCQLAGKAGQVLPELVGSRL